ncbi:hypothetical protein [Bacillus sp. 1NLA3E]|uniref:hypothetical protein n=1 Tax=Bacillus sp. 1NLA3E TaxID=666686 RepID=UPI000247E47A|nr:hypothetical protein [Bacillus sp. 1NLA3E]AGK54153.1 hypothetical protein B1NLA3E_12015 [Bacillus sp. 1NLA3E]
MKKTYKKAELKLGVDYLQTVDKEVNWSERLSKKVDYRMEKEVLAGIFTGYKNKRMTIIILC